MNLLNTSVLLHIGLGAGGGVALKCALGFCQHPEHHWRRYMTAPLFALFLYLEAVVTVNIIG